VEASFEFDETPGMSVQDVAMSVGLSYHAVLRAVHRGEIRAYKICGRVRLRGSDVRAWIDESRLTVEPRVPPETPPPARGSLEALRALERRMR
jgi:excisionase family DNA binding protein